MVTGAGQGIGRAIALCLAKAGYDLALQGRQAAPLERLRDELSPLGQRGVVVPGDVSQPEAAELLLETAERELGPVSVAVAAAGQASSAPVLKTDPEIFRALLEVNLLGPFHLLKAAAGRMVQAQRPGRIVLVGSTASVKGAKYTGAYAASKHGLLGLARSAAAELIGRGITVNLVCPGWVDTPMFDTTLANIQAKTGGTREEARLRIESMVPAGRVLSPEEVAGVVRYLVSEEASMMTGQALVLDGGETI